MDKVTLSSSNKTDQQQHNHQGKALENGSNGPDSTSLHDNTTIPIAGSSVLDTQDPATASAATVMPGFTTGDDYIAFPSFEEESDEDTPEILTVSRVKEREKLRAVPPEQRSRKKRSADEMNYDERDHANKKQRMDASVKHTPWVHNIDWDSCRNLSEMMHKEIKSFVEYISPTREEHEIRGLVIATITRVIQSTWPDAIVSPFGSYQTKLYLPSGDIDLVIQSRLMENYSKTRILFGLGQLLRAANITSRVQVIDKAKVPIIKFITTHGRFAVDISLNQTNGVAAGQMINRLLRELPALQSLVMTIKLFLNERNMNEVYTGGVGSYTLVCMVVSFLQMHPKIRAAEIDPSQNLGVLVMEFFELYGHHFNYNNTGISIRDGGTYFSKEVRGWANPRLPFLLSIEDPIDIANDVSKNSFNIIRVQKTLAGAYEVLTATAFMRARMLTAKARGVFMNLRGPGYDTRYDNQSILGSIIGVTQEILNHRRMIKQLYDQGTLQHILGITPTEYAPPSGGSSHVRFAEAVESAWGEADMDMNTTGSDSDQPKSNRRGRSPDEVEEESRYTRSQRPRKRQKVMSYESNGNGYKEPIYVEESDDDDEAGAVSDDYSPPPQVMRRSSRLSKGPRSHDPGRTETRRTYWMSKGIPEGN